MEDLLRNKHKVTQFVPNDNTLDWTSPVNIGVCGRKSISLDDLGSDLDIDISSITVQEGGYYILYVDGSDTYNVTFSTSLLAELAKIQGFVYPTLYNGEGSRNCIMFIWNDASQLESVSVSERLLGVINKGSVKYVPITTPLFSAISVENTSPTSLVAVFNQGVTGDLTGWSISSDGDPISINTLLSGSGTDTYNISLSRSVVPTEILTLSVDETNTILGVNGGLSLLPVVDESVDNNVTGVLVSILDKTFDVNVSPFTSAGGSTINGGELQIIGDGLPGADWIFYNWSSLTNTGDIVKITLFDVVRSGDNALIIMNEGANDTDGLITPVTSDGTFVADGLVVPESPNELYIILGYYEGIGQINTTRMLIEKYV